MRWWGTSSLGRWGGEAGRGSRFSPQSPQRKHRATRNGSVDAWRIAVPIITDLASRSAPRRWGVDVAESSARPRWPARAAANQPDHVTPSAGRGLGAAQRGCRGRAPLTGGGKIELASAGSGERTGDGPSTVTHLLYRPGYGSPARRAAAQRTGKVALCSSRVAASTETGYRGGEGLPFFTTESTEEAQRAAAIRAGRRR
jgi:hypothetical protein